MRGSTLQRALAGLLTLVLLGAAGYVATRAALGAFKDDYRVDVVVGESGNGLIGGSDVVMRGVLVGKVGAITLTDDLDAQVELVPAAALPRPGARDVRHHRQDAARREAGRGPLRRARRRGAVPRGGHGRRRPEAHRRVAGRAGRPRGAARGDRPRRPRGASITDGLGAFDGQEELIARSIDQGAGRPTSSRAAWTTRSPASQDLVAGRARSSAPRGEEFDRLAARVGPRPGHARPTTRTALDLLLDTLTEFADDAGRHARGQPREPRPHDHPGRQRHAHAVRLHARGRRDRAPDHRVHRASSTARFTHPAFTGQAAPLPDHPHRPQRPDLHGAAAGAVRRAAGLPGRRRACARESAPSPGGRPPRRRAPTCPCWRCPARRSTPRRRTRSVAAWTRCWSAPCRRWSSAPPPACRPPTDDRPRSRAEVPRLRHPVRGRAPAGSRR